MLSLQITPNPSIPDDSALPALTGRVKDFIATRLARRDPPERIAAGLRAHFAIAIDPAQVIPYWRGEIPRPTQTERRQDKESVQLPADEESEPLFTRMPDGEDAEATTQTGHRQDEDSLCIPADTVDEPTASDTAFGALGDLVRARLGIASDPAAATQTGHRRDRKTPTVLTDEVKAFIVRGLARYETPTRVAAAVNANFGIEIDRRQVFAYDPAGSRPPAQRWIDLHAATRAKFMQASSEIGIAQKLVRLRMLDRFANRAEEQNYTERAARFLAQAAKECGGFYERYQRPKAGAASFD